MIIIKELPHPNCTVLQTTVSLGHRNVPVTASVLGRDVWAYQMAKLKLQEEVIALRRDRT